MINIMADASEIGVKINEFLDMAVGFLKSVPWYLEAGILLVVAILLLIGIIRLIVKSWKLVAVLVLLGGIGFAVYYFFLRNGGSASESAALASSILQYFL